ncbi:hypothetical protein SXCC_03502 [Gluconacetobacter sp. SXCC-1]|nr:hypothetical protein SXCC_03502 [Gluconacetobacter sp. SXCC-1]
MVINIVALAIAAAVTKPYGRPFWTWPSARIHPETHRRSTAPSGK